MEPRSPAPQADSSPAEPAAKPRLVAPCPWSRSPASLSHHPSARSSVRQGLGRWISQEDCVLVVFLLTLRSFETPVYPRKSERSAVWRARALPEASPFSANGQRWQSSLQTEGIGANGGKSTPLCWRRLPRPPWTGALVGCPCVFPALGSPPGLRASPFSSTGPSPFSLFSRELRILTGSSLKVNLYQQTWRQPTKVSEEAQTGPRNCPSQRIFGCIDVQVGWGRETGIPQRNQAALEPPLCLQGFLVGLDS